jgi:hypothetical protein
MGKSPPEKPSRASKRADFLGALLRTAYLPTEVPPAVTTKYLSEFCRKEYNNLEKDRKRIASRPTSFDTFTAPRT